MTANEAWELMRELPKMSRDDLEEIYGTRDPWNVLIGYNPDEAQKELNDWKKKKEIQIGDEVEFDVTASNVHRTMYVTSRFNDEYYCGICENGDTYCLHKSYLTKTGRHIDFDKIKNLIAANGEEKPKTNGDMIRAMSDDELGVLLGNLAADTYCHDCIIHNNGHYVCNGSCKDNFKYWLKQPAERSEE